MSAQVIDDGDSLPQRLFDRAEDHFAQTGEWWLCFKVIELKLWLGLNICRGGWR